MTTLTITGGEAWAWSAGVSADYAAPFVQGDPVMAFGGSFTYPFNKKYSLSVSQALEKNFVIDAETREFELADSVVSFNIYPRTLIPKVGWTLRLMATLPVSESSRINEVYTKPEARWTAAYPLIDETINVALNAFVRYYLSRYDSTKPQDGSGGNPLPQYAYGIGHSGNWTMLPDWTLSYGLNYSEIRYHTITYEGSGDPALYVDADQFYSTSISVNWAITPEDSVNFSYSYGSVLLQPGIDDYVFFDKEDSRWSIGYARSFQE